METQMSLAQPYPELDEFLTAIGVAGERVSAIDASEGAAGNISVCIGWEIEVRRRFPNRESLPLPVPVPSLAGKHMIVTGSGRRLRDILSNPLANLGVVQISDDGVSATLFTAPDRLFAKVTSEFNSHLAVHADQFERQSTNFHAIIHAQPPHLTYLSHVPAYRDQAFLNRRLLRWEPETIVNLPEGVGVLPFMLPGSPDLMAATLEGLRNYRIVLWSKHGVMSRSDVSVLRAADRVEYAETAALYEYMDIAAGGKGEGLTTEELRAVVKAFNVPTTLV